MNIIINMLNNGVFLLTGNPKIIFIVIGAILIGIGIFLFFYRKKFLDIVMEIKYAETTTAKKIEENYKEISEKLGKGNYSEGVELKGEGKTNKPLKSQHTNTSCLWFKSQVIREYEETVNVTDSNGRRNTETRRGSETVSTAEDFIIFDLDDGSGATIKINPEGADIVGKQVYNQFKPGEYTGPLQFTLNALTGGRRTIGYRYIEEIIPVDQRLYILGEASDKNGILEVKKSSDKKKKFIVSVKSEEELIGSYSRTAKFMMLGAVCLPLTGIGLILFAIFGNK